MILSASHIEWKGFFLFFFPFFGVRNWLNKWRTSWSFRRKSTSTKSFPAPDLPFSASFVDSWCWSSMLQTWSREIDWAVERGAGKAECQGGSLVAVGGLWVIFFFLLLFNYSVLSFRMTSVDPWDFNFSMYLAANSVTIIVSDVLGSTACLKMFLCSQTSLLRLFWWR